MKIIINDQRKISEIQKEFTSIFSNLRIEFFARPSKVGSASSDKLISHSNNKKLLACRSTHKNGTIEILPFMSKQQLQDHFRDVFGLTIELFHKSKSASRSTPVSDNRSLDEENNAIAKGKQ